MKYRLSTFISMLLVAFSVVTAGEVWVSPSGNDGNAGTKDAPLRTVAQALKRAREWRRLSNPAVQGACAFARRCLSAGEGFAGSPGR